MNLKKLMTDEQNQTGVRSGGAPEMEGVNENVDFKNANEEHLKLVFTDAGSESNEPSVEE